MTTEERLDTLEKKLDAIKPKSKDGWDKFQISFGIVSGLLTGVVMPIVIALTGLYINQAIKVREGVIANELKDHESVMAKQLKEFDAQQADKMRERVERSERLDREVRYLGLIYSDLYSDEPKRKTVALKLIEALDPEMRVKLGSVVQADPDSSPEQVEVATNIVNSAQKVIEANLYFSERLSKIGIYYDQSKDDQKAVAESTKRFLANEGVNIVIQIYPRSSEFLHSLPFPAPIQLRYDEASDIEHDAADSLAAVLKAQFPGKTIGTYALDSSSNPTPGFLSIFLVPPLNDKAVQTP